ncbi:MAG: DUF4275 family protein [Clostridia bacterium]|nr:DUF4275 family protein [Clostridia bacterium]
MIPDNDSLIKKWLSVFGQGADEKLICSRVTSHGNFLWHLFTWGKVPCLEKDEARAAFDNLQYTEAIVFYDGYSNHIEGASYIGKLSAQEIDDNDENDIYVVAKDFSWTYVRTHEIGIGPFLCKK